MSSSAYEARLRMHVNQGATPEDAAHIVGRVSPSRMRMDEAPRPVAAGNAKQVAEQHFESVFNRAWDEAARKHGLNTPYVPAQAVRHDATPAPQVEFREDSAAAARSRMVAHKPSEVVQEAGEILRHDGQEIRLDHPVTSGSGDARARMLARR